MGDPIAYFEIVGGDGPGQQGFYRELFGWTVEPVESTGGTYARVPAASAGVEGGVGAFQGGPSYVTVYVRSDDPGAALERAEALGATRVMGPQEVRPGVTVAMFRDPAGNAVGLISGV